MGWVHANLDKAERRMLVDWRHHKRLNIHGSFGGLHQPLSGLLLLVLASCGPGNTPDIQTEFRDSAGVVIAESSSLPEAGAGGWVLSRSPELSIGSVEGDSDYEFYQVTGAVRLSDGRIAVSDNGTHQLRIYDPAGAHVATFGREGEGPAEFRYIQVMGTVGSDTLVILDGRQRRTSRFHPDLGFMGQTILPEEVGVTMHSNGMLGDGSIVFGGLVNWGQGDEPPQRGYERLINPFYSVSLDGGKIVHFGEFPGTEVVWTTSNIEGRESLAAAFVTFGLSPEANARGDLFALGTRDTYEVMLFDPSGELKRIIRVRTPPVAVTEAHLEGRLEQLLPSLPSPDMVPQFRSSFRDLPHADFMPAFESVLLDSEGYLWVEDVNIPGDTIRTWTVFDRDGSPRTRLSLPTTNRVLDIGPSYVLAAFQDELGVEFVRSYPLTRGG